MLFMKDTRTHNSIRNSIVALAMYMVNLVLQFISRKIFIEYLGEDVLGLNTTVTSILQFLNIAELGVGTAISCTLYTPISTGNKREISEIVALQGYIYRRIAFFILICSSVVMLFFPVIFAKISLPLWYAYSTFAVLLFANLLTYFVTYRQVVLSASQQEYKIQLSYKLWLLVKLIAQIVAIKFFSHGYLWWLSLEVLFAIIACISVNSSINKSFPFLGDYVATYEHLQLKYPSVKIKVGQLFFHKIATFALTQLSPIILYAYTSLSMVAKYGNYTLITMGVTSMLSAIFNGLNAGVGNLVAEGNIKRVLSVFRELFTSRFLIVSSCTICIYFLCNSFISLWVGSEFILDRYIVLLLCIIFYLNTMRTIVESYINAYGLFHDIWAPIVEASLNIGLSILLGHFWGLYGILLGVIVSLVAIVFVWKPILLFKEGFQHSIKFYIKLYLKHILVFCIGIIAIRYIVVLFDLSHCASFGQFVLHSIVLLALSVLLIGGSLYFVEIGMRNFVHRLSRIIFKK